MADRQMHTTIVVKLTKDLKRVLFRTLADIKAERKRIEAAVKKFDRRKSK